jgi:hypothetical protein
MLLFANGYSKTARIPPDAPDKNKPVQNWSNPPEIRQKLRTRQKYFLPVRRLSNPPEFSNSGGDKSAIWQRWRADEDVSTFTVAAAGILQTWLHIYFHSSTGSFHQY